MAVLPNMGINTPTLGGDSGTWDDKINAALALIDAHNHTSGKGVAIVSSGITVDADIPMAGFGLTSLGKLSFSTIAAPSTGSKNLFVNTADNELYWRSNAGANVKLTSGSSLNTSLVGGIVGDYSSVGAEVAFDDTNKRYTFKDQTAPTKKWARLASGPVRIFEYNTTESVYVEHAAAAALASSYTVTWPAALPGAQTMVQIGASGDLVYSNTIPANTNITLSGTGRVVQGTRVVSFTIHPDFVTTGSCTGGTDANGGLGSAICAVSTVFYSTLDGFLATDTVTQVVVAGSLLTGAGTPTYDLLKRDNTGAATSVLAAPTTSTTLTVNGGGTAPGSGGTLYLKVTVPAATTYAYYTAAATVTG